MLSEYYLLFYLFPCLKKHFICSLVWSCLVLTCVVLCCLILCVVLPCLELCCVVCIMLCYVVLCCAVLRALSCVFLSCVVLSTDYSDALFTDMCAGSRKCSCVCESKTVRARERGCVREVERRRWVRDYSQLFLGFNYFLASVISASIISWLPYHSYLSWGRWGRGVGPVYTLFAPLPLSLSTFYTLSLGSKGVLQCVPSLSNKQVPKLACWHKLEKSNPPITYHLLRTFESRNPASESDAGLKKRRVNGLRVSGFRLSAYFSGISGMKDKASEKYTMQVNTRQDKTRRDNNTQGNTRKDKTWPSSSQKRRVNGLRVFGFRLSAYFSGIRGGEGQGKWKSTQCKRTQVQIRRGKIRRYKTLTITVTLIPNPNPNPNPNP